MEPNFKIRIPGYTIEPSGTLPEEFKEYFLPGSEIATVSGVFGKMSVQQINLEEYRVYYAILAIKEYIVINLYYPGPLCLSHVLLQGNYDATIQGIGTTQFKQHTFSIVYHNYWNISSSFSKDRSYVILMIAYPATIIQPILAFYPRLEAFQSRIREHQPACLQQTAQPLVAGITELIYQLLHVPVVAATKQFHRSNIRAIITAMCAQLNTATSVEPYFSLSDIAIIHATKAFIDAHLDTHFTIQQLARTMGINEHKLKKGFKTIIGIGLFGYLLRQRLLIAKAQLEQTDKPVFEIARKAGYSSSANFCSAFQKMFGFTPYQFRKKKG